MPKGQRADEQMYVISGLKEEGELLLLRGVHGLYVRNPVLCNPVLR